MSVTLSQQYDEQELSQLLEIVRAALTRHFANEPQLPPDPNHYSEKLRKPAGCFVTLEVNHQLQGCIGAITSATPLIREVHNKTFSAAFRDRRFPPLTAEQLDDLTIEVSVLSEPQPLNVDSEQACLDFLEQNKLGVILSCGPRRAVFLPQVWEKLPQPFDFIRALKRKGGMEAESWPPEMRVEVFSVDSLRQGFRA